MKTRSDAIAYVRQALGNVVDEFSAEQIDNIFTDCKIVLWLTGAPDDQDVSRVEDETFWRIVQEHA